MIKAKLIIVGGDAKRNEINLKRLPATIGRANEAAITLPHALVSRQHCEIYEQDERLCVKDLNSLNGTYLNNEKISGSAPLLPGQLLTLGNVTFRADYDLAAGTPPSPAEPHIMVKPNADVPKQADRDTDHGPTTDTDEHDFDLQADFGKAEESISISAIAGLPSQQPQASFSAPIEMELDPGMQVKAEDINIDLGDANDAGNNPSQSSLDEFFRKMPK